MLKGRSNYEQITFVAAKGTRAYYQEAAALAGLSYKDWLRETLHARAAHEHAQRGVEREAPPVHPEPPPPLQRR